MIGILRPTKGSSADKPIRSANLGSFGLTATALSPSRVSGRVVAIKIKLLPSCETAPDESG